MHWKIGHKTHLEHGGESGTAGNHSDLTAHVGRVVELSLGSTGINGVANNELGEHLGNVSLRVRLKLEIMLLLAAIQTNVDAKYNKMYARRQMVLLGPIFPLLHV